MGMGIWEDLLRAGYRYVLELEIDGIATVFPEMIPRRVDSSAEVAPPAGYTACPALFFAPGQMLSQEQDRETGIARGDAVEICLAWEPLEEAGLTTTLFARPTKRTRLTADLAHAATSADVESTTGWTAGDRGYLGRELLDLGAITDSDTFGSLTRGVAGLPDAFRASSPTSFSFLTDKPEIWRGRNVRIRKHLLSPEGRALDSTWGSGDWSRIEWLGFLDEQPRPTETGMVLRALPLPRIASQEVGYEIGMEVYVPSDDPQTISAVPIVANAGSYLIIAGKYSGAGSGSFSVRVPSSYTTETPTTIGGWADMMRADLETALASEPWFTTGELWVGINGVVDGAYGTGSHILPQGFFELMIDYSSSYTLSHLTVTVLPSPELYWLRPGVFAGLPTMGGETRFHFNDQLKVQATYPAGAWLPVVQTEGEGYQDLAVPSTGAALLEVESGKELVRWDRALSAGAADARVALLHVEERGSGGTSVVEIVAGTKLTFVTGHTGTVGEVICTLLESSGTGTRGTYDTLGVGLGAGIDSSLIDEAGITGDPDLNLQTVAAYADGRTSLEELIGGWLSIHAKCLVQRRDANGDMRLTVVNTEPFAVHGFTRSLTRADVELSSIGTPEPCSFGNEVKVARTSIVSEVPPVVVQDVVAIQAAGPRSIEFACPGMGETLAVQLGASRIAAGLGLATLRIAIAPWFDAQIGDSLADRLAHPATYDWATGTRAPERIACVFAGEELEPYTGRRVGVFLLAGLLGEGLFLCPTATVLTVPTTSTVTTDIGSVDLYSPDDAPFTALFYNPGSESTESAELDVLADFELASGTWPAWVAPGTKITFAALGGGNHPELEPVNMFQAPTRNWGA